MWRRSWDDRFERLYTIYMNVEGTKYSSNCGTQKDKDVSYGIILVRGRKKKRQVVKLMLSSSCHLFPTSNHSGLHSVSEYLLNLWWSIIYQCFVFFKEQFTYFQRRRQKREILRAEHCTPSAGIQPAVWTCVLPGN